MLSDKVMPGNSPSDPFRWRAREPARTEGLSDAVFGFAITLLVISLEVPRTFSELRHVMSGWIAFAIGFVMLFMIWRRQFHWFRRYALQDELSITLNGARAHPVRDIGDSVRGDRG
jgi:uncharacterized membrane protein